MQVCVKLQLRGIAKNCTQTSDGGTVDSASFEAPMPQSKVGYVTVFATDAQYDKARNLMQDKKLIAVYGSMKARVVVMWAPGNTAIDIGIREVVDQL